MFVLIRNGTSTVQRRIDQRHVTSLRRSLYSRSLFESQEIGNVSLNSFSLLDSQRDRNQRESQTTRPSIQSHASSSQQVISSPVSNLQRPAFYKSKDALESLSYSILSGSSRDTAMNLLGATMNSRSAYRTIVYEPLEASLGLSFYNTRKRTYQYNSRFHFSSKTSKESGYSTSAKIPTPKSPTQTSLNPFAAIDPQVLLRNLVDMTWSLTKALVNFILRLPGNSWFYLTHPNERKEKIAEIKAHAKKEFDHYLMGSKLLMADVRTARSLLSRTMSGSTLTRRERKQLLRTVSDLFRLVPFSMFLIIPFMEFALPFALRLFPNMLPSTFQDSLKAEETMKRELQSRIAMAQFFQETLKELAKEQKRIAAKRNTETPDNKIASKQEQSAISMLEFLDRARNGEMIPPDVIVQYANYFQDDLTLDNMPRMQLINMCKYMGIPPYGADPFLRFQLRHKIRILKEDDQRILWEGIDSLTKMELREACQERGMRSTGLSKEAYKRSLQQWLDLSVDQNVPISLLIMSRTFFLQEEITPDSSDETKGVAGLADAISGLDKEVLNEVILEVATSEEKTSNPDVRKIKLEVLMHQNEKIREEREEREAATKKKGSSEKTEAQEGPQEVSEGTELGSKHSKVSHTDEAKSEEAKLVSKVGTAKTEPIIEDTTVFEMEKETEIKKQTTSEEEKIERDLSAEEMEAISQLLTADPVSKEREDLAKIKSAMKEEGEEELIQEDSDTTVDDASNESARANRQIDAMIEDKRILESDEDAAAAIEDIEKKAALDAEKATTFSTEPGVLSSSISQLEEASHAVEEPNDEGEDEIESDGEEDIIVARLKKRIQTMVDKIELQLSDVQVKIGDKLHILDKDMDGILTKEEMVECLQHVLKREISYEEAMEIAGEMDENKDGFLAVQELINWLETNKLVKYESEGRDADMDRVLERNHKDEQDPAEEVSVKKQNQGEKAAAQ